MKGNKQLNTYKIKANNLHLTLEFKIPLNKNLKYMCVGGVCLFFLVQFFLKND